MPITIRHPYTICTTHSAEFIASRRIAIHFRSTGETVPAIIVPQPIEGGLLIQIFAPGIPVPVHHLDADGFALLLKADARGEVFPIDLQ